MVPTWQYFYRLEESDRGGSVKRNGMKSWIPKYQNGEASGAKKCRFRQLTFPMNAVLRATSATRAFRALHHIKHSRAISIGRQRQYSTNYSDSTKDRSAVGVRQSHGRFVFRFCETIDVTHLKRRSLPLKRQHFSFSLAQGSSSTSDGKSNGCKNKSVSPNLWPSAYLHRLGPQKRKWSPAPSDARRSVARSK